MATNGTPHEGVDNVLINAYTGLQLVLYTNTADSLDRDTVLADLVEPAAVDSNAEANGYAAISLTGTWSSSSSVITYDHGGGTNPSFQNTGVSEDWDTANGCAVTDGTYVLHFKDFSLSRALQVGEILEIDISSLVS